MNIRINPRIKRFDKALRGAFIEKAVAENKMIVRAAMIFIIIAELINIIRVLFLSNSGLGTFNNRVYFTFYTVYFAGAVLVLALDLFARLSSRGSYALYTVAAVSALLWHTLFDMYDIYASDVRGYFNIIIAMFIICSLITIDSWCAIGSLAVCATMFITFLIEHASSGEISNFLSVTLLCMLIHFVRVYALYDRIEKERQIADMRKEIEEQKSFKLSAEQYELLGRQDNNMITFEWDIEKDRVRFSDEWTKNFSDSTDIDGLSKKLESSRILDKGSVPVLKSCIRDIKAGKALQTCDLMLRDRLDTPRWFELRFITQRKLSGRPAYGVGFLFDVTDKKNRITRLEREIQTDRFTGLFNKFSIESYGERMIYELGYDCIFIAIIIDLDGLREINDEYGHPGGDHVIKRLSEIIRQNLPFGARAGRIGGDEFIIMLKCGSVDEAIPVAEKILDGVKAIEFDGELIGASCSIGIAHTRAGELSYGELYRKADEALYEVKRSGKSSIVVV